MPRTISVLGIVVSQRPRDFHVVRLQGDDTDNLNPVFDETGDSSMHTTLTSAAAMNDDANSVVVLHELDRNPTIQNRLTRDIDQLATRFQAIKQNHNQNLEVGLPKQDVMQLFSRGEGELYEFNDVDTRTAITKTTQIARDKRTALDVLKELMRQEFDRILARRPLVEPIVVPNEEVEIEQNVDNMIEDDDEDIIPSPIPARRERLLDDNNALPDVLINEADVDLIEALRVSLIVENDDEANQRLIDALIQADIHEDDSVNQARSVIAPVVGSHHDAQDAGFEAENISIVEDNRLELSNQDQTNVNSNVPRPIPVAAHVPPRPPQNVSMMVLGGFIAALGISAVTYAFIALHAPFLVTACVVVLGMAAMVAGIRFFSKGANPPRPPAGEAQFDNNVLSNLIANRVPLNHEQGTELLARIH